MHLHGVAGVRQIIAQSTSLADGRTFDQMCLVATNKKLELLAEDLIRDAPKLKRLLSTSL
ncbi:hypothetical protein XdyCFBP7245_12440 [Xanthomonas dyei]|uniref:Uncharacterized protein n=1 Tax=Xanthomonas dyei TaxID=743699 RepID=A0A2S7C2G5_9XANT|nr:hypothetical protein XdyCFBP7245_12440 [Xanthomonas dyei]